MTDHESHERSSLLHPGVSRRSGRHPRLSRKSLAFFLLLAVGVACLALTLRRLDGCSIRPSKIPSGPLLLSDEFDAIVVGGGPAGSVLAKLLSDDPWQRVVLMEAGNTSQTQLGGQVACKSSPLDRWRVEHLTTSCSYVLSGAIRSRHHTKGLTSFDCSERTPSLHWAYPDVNVAKALGGCGIHNAMLYCTYVDVVLSDGTSSGLISSDGACVFLFFCSHTWSYEPWHRTLNAGRWRNGRGRWPGSIIWPWRSSKDRKSSYHSTHGPLHVTSPTFKTNWSHELLDACVQLGLPRTDDFNAPRGRYGAGLVPL
ncbi:hypothetical protein PsorP6_011439 [Peronosclerospora sorghi]|uniref:Uncharacterized protein n=1 Tax=Peronosclerospora sorghi TaxID=230839 RepID=A0ACC0WKI8_9STRA|nr:hypothetical protein PsorP6_011439 [Peronosclerospora sorghi]